MVRNSKKVSFRAAKKNAWFAAKGRRQLLGLLLKTEMTDKFTKKEIEDVLRRNMAFSSLSREAAAAMAGSARIETWLRGAVILQEGEHPQGVYFLLSGGVLLRVEGAGRSLTFGTIRPGEVFGMFPVLENAPCPFSVAAIAPVTTALISRRAFLEYAFSSPQAAHSVMKQLCADLRSLAFSSGVRLIKNTPDRLLSMLQYLAGRHGRRAADGSLAIDLPLTHQQLAAFTTLSRESVCLAVNKLKRAGKVTALPGHRYALPRTRGHSGRRGGGGG